MTTSLRPTTAGPLPSPSQCSHADDISALLFNRERRVVVNVELEVERRPVRHKAPRIAKRDKRDVAPRDLEVRPLLVRLLCAPPPDGEDDNDEGDNDEDDGARDDGEDDRKRRVCVLEALPLRQEVAVGARRADAVVCRHARVDRREGDTRAVNNDEVVGTALARLERRARDARCGARDAIPKLKEEARLARPAPKRPGVRAVCQGGRRVAVAGRLVEEVPVRAALKALPRVADTLAHFSAHALHDAAIERFVHTQTAHRAEFLTEKRHLSMSPRCSGTPWTTKGRP